jgi:hypothetical protein
MATDEKPTCGYLFIVRTHQEGVFIEVSLIHTRTYMEAVRKIGFTIASILAAISSAGMRSGVWYHRRAAPKMAQAAVVASSLGSVPGTIACFAAVLRKNSVWTRFCEFFA